MISRKTSFNMCVHLVRKLESVATVTEHANISAISRATSPAQFHLSVAEGNLLTKKLMNSITIYNSAVVASFEIAQILPSHRGNKSSIQYRRNEPIWYVRQFGLTGPPFCLPTNGILPTTAARHLTPSSPPVCPY